MIQWAIYLLCVSEKAPQLWPITSPECWTARLEPGIVNELSQSAMISADRVQTLRGSLRGIIVRLLDGGRVTWKLDGTTAELIALPESLRPEE